MKLTKSNLSQIYYSSILVFLIFIAITGVFLFHSQGFLSFQNVRTIYEGNHLIEALKKTNKISEITNDVNKNQIREAYKILAEFEKELDFAKEIGRNDKNFDNFQKSLKTSSSILYDLISLPELSSVYVVLKNKVSDLHTFISSNNWKTLGRMSSVLKEETFSYNLEKSETSNYRKVISLEGLLRTNFLKMIAITNSSSLPQEKKDQIVSKFDTFKTEMEMLKKYISKTDELLSSLKSLDAKFKNWTKTSSINISLKKIQFESGTDYLFYSLMGFIGLIFTFLFLGFYLNKYFKNNNLQILEKSILEVFREGVISNKSLTGYSTSFTKELDIIREYIHKRISFGSIVFDSLPFGTIFLDENLSVVWANDVFFHVWGLEKEKNEMMTWDYIQRFTNLGENDPILSALKEGMSGIYQIQVKRSEKDDAIPFEMYVQPTIYQKQKRIVIFLYPLKSLQESLLDQTKSIIGPIGRTIDAMTQNQFDERFRKNIQKDYEVGGIEEILNKFSKFNETISNQRTELLVQLEKIENNLCDQFKLRNDIKEILTGTQESATKGLLKISELKETFICNIELREKIEQNGLKIGELAKTTNSDFSDLLAKAEQMNQTVRDGLKAFEKLYGIRESIKIVNEEVQKFKNKGRYFSEKNDGLKQREIDAFVASFSTVMVNLETSISKIELTLKGNSEEKIDDFKEKLIFSKNIYSKQIMEFKELSSRIAEFDEKIVRLFKVIYESQKESEGILKNVGLLVAEGYREIGPQLNNFGTKEIN